VKTQEVELTITQAGQLIGKSPAQVTRLITLGLLSAHRDGRGWWKVSAESAQRYVEHQPQPAA
jgi:hypothetical protein